MTLITFRCKEDPVLSKVRKTYHATPLAVPDSATQPLEVVAYRGKKAEMRGQIASLLLHSGFDLKPKQAIVANAEFERTRQMNLELGVKLLGQFLGGFLGKEVPIKADLKSKQTLSFQFKNVTRRYIPPIELGKSLKNHQLDLGNSSMSVFTREKRPFNMLLISSVLVSNGFEIELSRESGQGVGLDIDGLAKTLAPTQVAIDLAQQESRKVSFTGPQPLTFAFSCIELFWDKVGRIQLGEMVNIKGEGEDAGETNYQEVPEEKSLLHPDMPALLRWDTPELIGLEI